MDPIYKLLKTIQKTPNINYHTLSISCKLTKLKFDKAFSDSKLCDQIELSDSSIVSLTDDGIDYIKEYDEEKHDIKMQRKTTIRANIAIDRLTYVSIIFGTINLIFALLNLYLLFNS